jgi:hypothetical protein
MKNPGAVLCARIRNCDCGRRIVEGGCWPDAYETCSIGAGHSNGVAYLAWEALGVEGPPSFSISDGKCRSALGKQGYAWPGSKSLPPGQAMPGILRTLSAWDEDRLGLLVL